MHAIEHLTEYPLGWKDLEALPGDQKALIALANYAATEVNALHRNYLFSSHDFCGQDAIDLAISAQRLVLLRCWSAKMFEFSKSIEKLAKGTGTNDRLIIELATQAVSDFAALKQAKGYYVVENLRHEATNHFSFKAAKKNLNHVSPSLNCNLYVHELNGNSHFPMGEAVMFFGRLNRHGASLKTTEEKEQLLDFWMEWNLRATRWVSEVHVNIMAKLVFDRFGDRKWEKKTYWIDPELVGGIPGRRIPVFLRNEAGQ